MFRILLFVVTTLVAVSVSKFSPECLKHTRSFEKCCKTIPLLKLDEKTISECYQMKKPPPSCESDICMAKHYGFAGSVDGKFDKTKLIEHLQNGYPDDPELAMNIISKCVNGDLSAFGLPDFCDLTKFRHCLMVNVGKACKEWDGSAECQKTKEAIEDCAN